MKKFIALAGLILITSSAPVVAQESNRTASKSSTQSAAKGQKVKPGKAKVQKDSEGKPSEASKFSKDQILKVQKALRRYDYYDGPMDGKMNADLHLAIKDFQEDEGLAKTGELDDETLKRILSLQDEDSGEESPPQEPPRR